MCDFPKQQKQNIRPPTNTKAEAEHNDRSKENCVGMARANRSVDRCFAKAAAVVGDAIEPRLLQNSGEARRVLHDDTAWRVPSGNIGVW